jgi:hypothetical protein
MNGVEEKEEIQDLSKTRKKYDGDDQYQCEEGEGE